MAFKTLMGIERLLSELGINLHMELEQLEGERLTLFQSVSCQRAVRLLTAAGIPFPDVLYEETTRTPHFRGRLSVHAGANKQDTQVEWIASFKDEVTPCFEVLKFKLDPSFKDDVILWLYEEPVMEGDWLIFHDIDRFLRDVFRLYLFDEFLVQFVVSDKLHICFCKRFSLFILIFSSRSFSKITLI